MAAIFAGQSTSTPPLSAAPTKPKRRQNNNNVIYANPLPILLETPRSTTSLGLFSPTRIVNPKFSAIYDPMTRSVWVTGKGDVRVLWERGFFGKGSLSRSEPTWLTRRVMQLNGGDVMTAEEITAKRREQRKQFKASRAAAIQKAAQEAEASFSASLASPGSATYDVPLAKAPHNVPRPTFEPAACKGNADNRPSRTEEDDGTKGADGVETIDEDDVENMEHLQLTLQEAFFLAWGLDCLRILDTESGQYLSLQTLWSLCLSASASPNPFQPAARAASHRMDNPFLINYIVYHHFRSLGWVVRGGIKFCVDYLLYKRGPVFTHAEFAVVICPVYEDPEDAVSCPFSSMSTEPFTWSWFSTISRVNTQVKKTVILAYVTIPAMTRTNGRTLDGPGCLGMFSVREVVIRRFVPARMRD
ncbi:hypothetical protein DACRYDRAFT_114863 [Dacryopinax primogenitus]|uniref:tRNA-splicing endonuclease subunit Sen2 n=1 Tax=Dacryopinax primogenitus (strain DJM 731) TaxID=1858805 RepID=M5FZK7_DACPD|nr:uncharacterized protein DACRYDRAFT_114863 [Dacryopinax primogenitus]EJU03466.1 hypothetical protein DACRYDRAFT_114863 [Dacryopinax primogenitus]